MNHLLTQTAQSLLTALQTGALGRPIPAYRVETIAGPRAGAVRVYAGLETGTLYRLLSSNDAALARQFFAWQFPGHPAVYLDGRAVRLEAAWPPELQKSVRLRDICPYPKGNGRWVVGVNEFSQTVIACLDDRTPNWLVAGTTGSGKTTVLLSVGLQMAQDPTSRLILIDGKEGAGLSPLANLPNVIGPIATDIPMARGALAWVHSQLQERYQIIASAGEGAMAGFPRLVVIFDEFQEFAGNPGVAELLRRIVSRGRAARIHVVAATQHPVVAMFGDPTVKRNMPGRVALRVLDAKASELVVGSSTPRADYLLGQGDAYVIGGQVVHRTQVALVGRKDLDEQPRQSPQLDQWPEFDNDFGQEPPERRYTGEELALALIAAAQGWGRPRLQEAFERAGLSRPGSSKADLLLRLGREQLTALGKFRYNLREEEEAEEEHFSGPGPGDIVDAF